MSNLTCAMTGLSITGNGDAYWDDGEWVSWEYIDSKLGSCDSSWDHTFESNSKTVSTPAPSTLQLWEMLGDMVELAREYNELTGRHLPIYGEMGELYGEAKYGIKRHRENTAGSDGRLGNDWVEIKTISPFKSKNIVQVKRAGNFNKLLIVKISEDFEFKAHMIDRKHLNKGEGKFAKVSWPSGD